MRCLFRGGEGRVGGTPTTWLSCRFSLANECAAVAVLALASCAGRPATVAPVQGGSANYADVPATAGDSPGWVDMPHSWGRLTEIESWLEAAERRRDRGGDAFWKVEGALQLAEGKLAFAEERGGASDRILSFRRDAARDGFRSVASNPLASKQQVARAKRGLLSLDGRVERAQPAAAGAPPSVHGLVRRRTWSANAPDRSNLTPARSPWRWITVHHSVFRPEGSTLAASLDCVRKIQRNHLNTNGWGDIGYHYLIDRAGRVIEGRELVWQGAHAGGANNRGNVGICLLGNFEEEHPTAVQLASLDRLVYELQAKLRIPRANVRPHKAWGSTVCPGRHLMPWFARS